MLWGLATAASALLMGGLASSGEGPPPGVAPGPAADLGAAAWTTASCGGCHQAPHALSHPVGVRPSMPIPEAFPLDSGRMACTTCHTADRAAHDAARRQHDPMLRTDARGRQFCLTCHSGPALDPHVLASARAHLDGGPGSAGPRAARAGGVDAESQSCLSCHDGAGAPDAGGAGTHGSGTVEEHPVGVLYPARARRSDGVPFVRRESLNPSIRLFDGAVGCGSCHSAYSPHRDMLVMSNARSALCLSCHAY